MRAVALVFVLLLSAPLQAESGLGSFLGKITGLFGKRHNMEEKVSVKRTKFLTLTLQISPEVVKLPETRRIKVSLDLRNHSKRYVRLEFPTTQRFDALIREKNGQPLVRWSEDESFSNESANVIINPGEHLEYIAMLPTRDLAAGRLYEVEFFLPNSPELSITRSFVPVD